MSPGQLARLGLALALLLVVAGACSEGRNGGFPSFVYASDLSLESYRAAATLPSEVMASIPCYCGCSTLVPPHRSLQDCFYFKDGSYNEHAAGCSLCGRIAVDVREAYEQGQDVEQIRASIESTYSVYGSPTETPTES